jgi:lysophospholipase L1-like esterase
MTYSYLALGDSYTIGEQVPFYENFPNQTIQLLRKHFKSTHHFSAAEIMAKTGWTTDELLHQMSETAFLPKYDFVSLLIGVNNQYRGLAIENFKTEFTLLLQKAIAFSGGNNKHVFVLSIPDWGVTPFAADRDANKIATEIDAYNSICKEIAEQNNCYFIDITTSQRQDGANAEFLAEDKLHPSGKEYGKWAEQLHEKMVQVLDTGISK